MFTPCSSVAYFTGASSLLFNWGEMQSIFHWGRYGISYWGGMPFIIPLGPLKPKSYKDLEIYNSFFELALELHQLSLKFPKFEMYEEGSQLRRYYKNEVTVQVATKAPRLNSFAFNRASRGHRACTKKMSGFSWEKGSLKMSMGGPYVFCQ